MGIKNTEMLMLIIWWGVLVEQNEADQVLHVLIKISIYLCAAVLTSVYGILKSAIQVVKT